MTSEDVKQWLRDNYISNDDLLFHDSILIRKRMECADGFSMSVQATKHHYCLPKEDRADGNYIAVEIGYPSQKEDLIVGYAEDFDYCNTVYHLVPIGIVADVVNKHGGLKLV